MNSGIRDAHNLAWKLHAVSNGLARPKLLDSYEQERKDHVWQMIGLALRMGRVMSPPSWLHETLTQLGFLALNVWPPARNYVAQMKYKPPPRFKQGFLVPDGNGRRSLVGRLLPQPAVRLADGREVLLDEVIGPRFALLMRGADAPRLLDGLQHAFWDELGAVRIAVLPAGASAADASGPTDVLIVTEADTQLVGATAPYPTCALLLRPDHYVAAAVPAADPDAAERIIAALVSSGAGRAPAGQHFAHREAA